MKNTVLRTSLLASAAFAVLFAGPLRAQDAATAEPTPAPAPADYMNVDANTVVATVNGEDITLGNLISARLTLPDQYQALPNDVLLKGLLEQLIQQTVLGQAAGEMTLRDKLELENEKRAIMATSEIDKITATAVDEAAIQAAYDAQYANAEPTKEWNASHILVATEDEAKALIEELNNGADFAALAKEKSTGPSGPNGGELGWFSAGMMVKPFEDAVKEMKDGEIAGPVKTQFGWHVIKLNESRMKGAPPLDSVKDEIVTKLQNDAVEKAIAAMLADAKIERTDLSKINPAALSDLSLID